MKNIPMVVVAVVLLGLGYFWLRSGWQTPNVTEPVLSTMTLTGIVIPTGVPSARTFEVKGANYLYDVKEIKVKLNDEVKINFVNTEGMHDFKIDEFGVATKVTKAGESEMVVFTANKKGTFEYYCSVGQHRANGMWGKLVVE